MDQSASNFFFLHIEPMETKTGHEPHLRNKKL